MHYKDGITYNGYHSNNEFDLIKVDVENYTTPTKKKIYETVPFMSGSYDFSNILSDSFYEERELTYIFALDIRGLGITDPLEVERMLEIKKIKIENWLLNSNTKTKLLDDSLDGYYYMAECTGVEFNKWYSMGQLTVTFIAYPFKISELNEGHDIWDLFDFDLDYAQDTKYTVKTQENISLYNIGSCSATPTVVCSAPMEIEKNGVIYKFSAGSSKSWRFTLSQGENSLIVRGDGLIEFIWQKEVL